MAVCGGSSPLARGLLVCFASNDLCHGIIPARAGFTHHRPPRQCCLPDHPRSRGVYSISLRYMGPKMGSSPLARGLHEHVEDLDIADGIIPARAGFTSHTALLSAFVTDHPRSRGVYVKHFLRRIGAEGSSPLARGLLRAIEKHHTRVRIIPARAGFTAGQYVQPESPSDHPRSRGVY